MKTKAAYSSSHRQLLYPERDRETEMGQGFLFFTNMSISAVGITQALFP
jgi:hypothetical protein